jgi:CPA2 family monovalent cation:H+ antiporter-2
MVVGIERNGKRLLNPESDLILQKNDILWVVDEKREWTNSLKIKFSDVILADNK